MFDINKKYRTRDGREVSMLHRVPDGFPTKYPWRGVVSDSEHSWTENGENVRGVIDARDLIEVREPREFAIVVSTPANKHYRDKPVVDGQATDELDNGVQPVGNWEVIRVREVTEPC